VVLLGRHCLGVEPVVGVGGALDRVEGDSGGGGSDGRHGV